MRLKDLQNVQNVALLFDFYGSLLTPRQQELMQAYYLEDLSLAEIAEQSSVSRQAVHDLIKRSEAALTEYEEKLGFVREYQLRQERLTRLEAAINGEDRNEALAVLEQLKAE